jgi:hypothetical protein
MSTGKTSSKLSAISRQLQQMDPKNKAKPSVEFVLDHTAAGCSKRLSSEAAGEGRAASVPIFHPPNPEPAKTGSVPLVR